MKDKPTDKQQTTPVPLFFIIGRPRSGTTMLRLLFDAHPNVLIPPECPFIISLYKKYGKVTCWDEPMIKEFCEDLSKQRYFDKWLIEKDHLFNCLMEAEGESTFQTMVMHVNLAYTSVYDKKELLLIGDKNPGYSLYINRIHKLFPDSKIIHITRDYRDNYLSLIKVNFEVPIVPLVVYRWKFALKRMWKLKKKCPDLIYSIRYEDLATNPEQEFQKLCRFLNIRYDPSVMNFYEKKAEIQKAYSGDQEISLVHHSLLNPISTQRMNLWKTQMSEHDIRVADLVMGKTADKAGYERKYPSFNPVLYLWILPTLVYAAIMYQLILLGDHLPYKMRNSLNHILGIFLKVYWKFNNRKVKPIS
ncbi:MAG: sulfotransferase [Lentimicrobiaceae bacterium]